MDVLIWLLTFSSMTFLVITSPLPIISTHNFKHQTKYGTICNYLNYFVNANSVSVMTVGLELYTMDTSTLAIQCIEQHLQIPTSIWKIEMPNCGAISRTSLCEDALLMILHYDVLMTTLKKQTEICIQNWNSRTQFMFIILHTHILQNNNVLSVFEKLWQQYNILYVVIVTIKVSSSDKVSNIPGTISGTWRYNPFSSHLYNDVLSTFECWNLQNLNGLPLRVSLFAHYPSAYLLSQSNSKTKVSVLSVVNGYGFNWKSYRGVDGQMFATMVDFMNFTPKVINPIYGASYGFPLLNGTFTGALGEVIYKHVDISFNSRFIKQYNSTDIEFSNSIMSDRMCVIVPKAKPIPRWRRMLLSFNSELWLILFCTFIVIAGFQFILRLCQNSKKSELFVIFETIQVFLLTSRHRSPKVMSERCFYASCLTFCLVVMNAFQGLLVTNITYPNYEADINTLMELDQSGLPIWSRSPENRDIFTNMGSSVMENLLRKFDVFNGSAAELLNHVANLSDASVIVRETSTPYTESMYVAQDGSQLIHTVYECPAYYHLAYIVPKGSPYLPIVNIFILKMNEAGLTFKWHKDATDVNSLLGSNIRDKFETEEALRVFSLTDLQLAFYIIVTGLTFSTTVFVIEVAKFQTYIFIRK